MPRGALPSPLTVGYPRWVSHARTVADEPTGDLDARNAEAILALLRQLENDFGKTIVMVTHDPRALRFVDDAFHLDKGILLEGDDADRAEAVVLGDAPIHDGQRVHVVEKG